MNKVFELENELLEAQIVGEEWKGRFEGLRGEKDSVEQLKNDLQSEYMSLKSSYREVGLPSCTFLFLKRTNCLDAIKCMNFPEPKNSK